MLSAWESSAGEPQVQRTGRVVASENWQDRFVRDALDNMAREVGQERWDAEADVRRGWRQLVA